MSESGVWIIDDNEPAPPEATPRFELPRLQIIHLLMWMAATAIAFLPYRVQQVQFSRLNPAQRTEVENPAIIAMGVGSGILSGAYLFVTAAVIVWRRRGYRGPTLPGHYLAYRGAGLWAPALTTQTVLWTGGADLLQMLLVVVPYAIVYIVFFVWFLRLARRRTTAPAWRRALGVTVVAPVVAWVLTYCWMFLRMRNSYHIMAGMALIQGLAAALVALMVILAMRADARNNADRHWSHLIGAIGRVAESSAYCLMYVAMGLYAAWR